MTLARLERRIVFLCYDGMLSLDANGPLEVFDVARRLLAARQPDAGSAYRLELVAWQPDLVQTTSGLQLYVPAAARALSGPIDTLVVPGGLHTWEFGRQPGVVPWLREAAAASRRVTSVCTGSVLLAQAGLVDGRRITSHWAACDKLAQSYPSAVVDDAPIFTKSEKFYTSAGATAGMDLALALVEEDWGAALALEVARWLVMFMQRPGNQAQRSVQLSTRGASKRGSSDLRAWIAEHLDLELGVDALARRVGMSRRNFCRTFQQDTGMTPARYVEAARVEAAQRWLTQSDLGLDEIARRCGFGSAETLRRSFRRSLGVTPSSYRERERGPSAAAEAARGAGHAALSEVPRVAALGAETRRPARLFGTARGRPCRPSS